MGIGPRFYFLWEGSQERDFVPLNPGSAGMPHVPVDVASSPGASRCSRMVFPSELGMGGTGFAGIVGP